MQNCYILSLSHTHEIKHENLLSIYENMDYFQIMLFNIDVIY